MGKRNSAATGRGDSKLVRQTREGTAVQDQLAAFREDLRLSDRDLAKLAGVSTSTIRRWRASGFEDPPEPLDRLRAVVLSLAQQGDRQPAEIGRWLRSRNRSLGFERPIDVLELSDHESLLAVIRAADAFLAVSVLPESRPMGSANGGEAPTPDKKIFTRKPAAATGP